MKDTETKRRFVELRAAGKSLAVIAKELHTAKSTLVEWSRELETEIHNLRQVELESLADEYQITKRARVAALAARLATIRAAVEKADLSKVDPEHLLKLELMYTQHLAAETAGGAFIRDVKEGAWENAIAVETTRREVWQA